MNHHVCANRNRNAAGIDEVRHRAPTKKFQALERFAGVFSKRWNFFTTVPALMFVLSFAASFDAQAGGWANLNNASPSGVYLGDTPTMGTIFIDAAENGNNRDQALVVARVGNADLNNGTRYYGAVLGGNATTLTTLAAPQAVTTGTWHWGVEARWNYGSGTYFSYHHVNGWAYASFGSFGGNAQLSYTVNALVNPSNQSATAASASQINLSWARGVSGGSTKDTLVLRSTSST
ncbi:MAG: hypothetical protein ACO3ZG_05275, partial [Kiritimatiellia bacterium]